MDLAEVKQLIDSGTVEYVKIGSPDIEGVYRGKRVAAQHFLHSLEEGFAQCDELIGWDIAENVLPNLTFSNWEHGFSDIVMKPDLATFARFDALSIGETLRLIFDHRPGLLQFLLIVERPGMYEWEPERQGPETWIIRLRKTASER